MGRFLNKFKIAGKKLAWKKKRASGSSGRSSSLKRERERDLAAGGDQLRPPGIRSTYVRKIRLRKGPWAGWTKKSQLKEQIRTAMSLKGKITRRLRNVKKKEDWSRESRTS